LENSKQNPDFGECKGWDSDGVSRYWHRQMVTDSLLRLGPRRVPRSNSNRKRPRFGHRSNMASKKRSTICFCGFGTPQDKPCGTA